MGPRRAPAMGCRKPVRHSRRSNTQAGQPAGVLRHVRAFATSGFRTREAPARMEQIERLPRPLRKIGIPLHLSVTRLAASGPCLLRAVAPRSDLPRAPSGPQAEFGKVVHTLTDLAATGRLGTHSIPSDVEAAFEYLLAEAASRLASNDETRRYANLSVGFTRREWEKRRFLAITGAEELVGK